MFIRTSDRTAPGAPGTSGPGKGQVQSLVFGGAMLVAGLATFLIRLLANLVNYNRQPVATTLERVRLPIYVFIGTKAQYIKTAPLLRLMQATDMPYFLIDSGQHAAFAPALRKKLGIKEPDAALRSNGDITSVTEAAIWFLRYLGQTIFRPGRLRREIFPQGPGICVIHGDTPSTLLALILAKRAGMKIAHIEAGLRSFNILKPFPEELVRVICMHFSDFLFCPSDWAFENLKKMKPGGKTYNVEQNTSVEALTYSLLKSSGGPAAKSPYCLLTIHRVETILNKRRLTFIVELAERIAKECQVVFVLHEPTRKKLVGFGLIDRIQSNANINSFGLVDHGTFLNLIAGAEYVISDGGSIQEECHYLDVPCLVMRSETERMEGLGQNVRLSDFDPASIDDFLANYATLRAGKRVESIEPSKRILEVIAAEARP